MLSMVNWKVMRAGVVLLLVAYMFTYCIFTIQFWWCFLFVDMICVFLCSIRLFLCVFSLCAQYPLSFRPVNIDPGCWRCMVLGCRYYRGANLKRDAGCFKEGFLGQKDQAKLRSIFHMDVSKNRGTPKGMVKIMENPIKMDDLGGKPTIFGNIHIQYFQVLAFWEANCWDTFIWWLYIILAGWWQLTYFLFSSWSLGKWSNLTIIFFKRCETTN